MANAAPFHFKAVKYFAWHVTACARKKMNGERIFICRREGDRVDDAGNGRCAFHDDVAIWSQGLARSPAILAVHWRSDHVNRSDTDYRVGRQGLERLGCRKWNTDEGYFCGRTNGRD